MDSYIVPKINPDYLVEQFDNEVVLFTVSGGEVIALNQTAHVVWRLCQEGVTVGEMIRLLAETYPDQAGEIKDDVIAALQTMVKHRIITLADDA